MNFCTLFCIVRFLRLSTMVMRQRSGLQSLSDDSILDTSTDREEASEFPPTYYVIEFNPTVKSEVVRWIVSKIRAVRQHHGAELLVRKQRHEDDSQQGLILHISARSIRLLETAEDMELRKRDRHDSLRHFTINELEDFLPRSGDIGCFLTSTEKQSIVKHELDNVRAMCEDEHVPGYPQLKLYEGQSLVEALMHWKLIRQMFPLHDEEYLKALGHSWYKSLSKDQPFEDIHAYFGESIALYFHFLNFYSYSLVVPMILGFYQLLVSPEMLAIFCVFNVLWATGFLVVSLHLSMLAFFCVFNVLWATGFLVVSLHLSMLAFFCVFNVLWATGFLVVSLHLSMLAIFCVFNVLWATGFLVVSLHLSMLAFFCVFNVLWATGFLVMWNRKCSELAFQWGTINMTSLDDTPRPTFHGKMGEDTVTGKMQPQYPAWKTYTKMYCVSFPLVGVCMLGAFLIMLSSFWLDQNHRTQSQFDRYRITKLVLFEFVNNFMSLFYVAFYIQDLEMLRTQLAVLLTIYQLINNLQESILPLILQYTQHKVSIASITKRISSDKIPLLKNIQGDDLRHRHVGENKTCVSDDIDLPELNPDDPRITQTKRESQLDPYEGTYDDYLELFIQFGYVYLFSAVFPMAAFWALINNMLEVRSDAFKLCCLYQRPIARRVKNIGAWQRAFECLCAISVMTNCALLFMIPELRSLVSTWSPSEVLFLFVVFEHILLLLRYVLVYCISDKPHWVRVALAKLNYQSRQALKNQRLLQNRKSISLKFQNLNISH
ncbi:hypothetical protein M8J75_000032 [Diaphorina citri]|nr:hypothetical protein M8J75_000032 [Diaphorina citri]